MPAVQQGIPGSRTPSKSPDNFSIPPGQAEAMGISTVPVSGSANIIYAMARVHEPEHGSTCSQSPLHGSYMGLNPAEAGGLQSPSTAAADSSVKSVSSATMGTAAADAPERSSLSTVGPHSVVEAKVHSLHAIADSTEIVDTLASGHATALAAARPATVKDSTGKLSCALLLASECSSVATIDETLDELGGHLRNLCGRAEYSACGCCSKLLNTNDLLKCPLVKSFIAKAVQLPAPHVLRDIVVELGGLNTKGTKHAIDHLENAINQHNFAQKEGACTLHEGPGTCKNSLTTTSSSPVASPCSTFFIPVFPSISDHLDFMLVSMILRSTQMSYLAWMIHEDAAPCLAWAREGIGTRSQPWN
ncbi:hypothetical protein GGX14DRAFT_393108 [Mycena pura]|uniref:Uncharacterized protein n=1 Tax=Mycena pura TaxID=153505 RepID=A0AAD6VI61_9AGAR|nr:hypothetical protein GGX14DRAFT_393108 [Mycena pura]